MGNLIRSKNQLLINSLTDLKVVIQARHSGASINGTKIENMIISTPHGNAVFNIFGLNPTVTAAANTFTAAGTKNNYAVTAYSAGTKQIDEVYVHPYYPTGVSLTIDESTKYNVYFKLYRKPKFNGDPLELIEIHRTYTWIGAITDTGGFISQNETAATSIMKDINADVESPVYACNKLTGIADTGDGITITTSAGSTNHALTSGGSYDTIALLAAKLVALGYFAEVSGTEDLYFAVPEGVTIAAYGTGVAVNKAYLYLVAKTTDDQFQTIIEPKMGTVTTAVAGVYPVFTADDVYKEFVGIGGLNIKYGGRGHLPIDAEYVKVKVFQTGKSYSLDGANHTDSHYDVTELFVLKTVWQTSLAGYVDAVYTTDAWANVAGAATTSTQTLEDLLTGSNGMLKTYGNLVS